MKTKTGYVLLAAVLMPVLTGCNFDFRPKVPEEWYRETLQYYRDGFADGWKSEREGLMIADEMKDEENRFGYLLTDLDGDGTEEVLIGYMDDADETRIIDVFIWHSDRGAFRILHAGDGYYIYLCEGNILRMDEWRGSETDTRFMRYQSKDNAFLILDEEAKPLKLTLTAF